MTHIEKLKCLSGPTFWLYFLEFKHELKLVLDNDSTGVVNLIETEEEEENGFDSADCPASIGCSDGLVDLLVALGINCEYC